MFSVYSLCGGVEEGAGGWVLQVWPWFAGRQLWGRCQLVLRNPLGSRVLSGAPRWILGLTDKDDGASELNLHPSRM